MVAKAGGRRERDGLGSLGLADAKIRRHKKKR